MGGTALTDVGARSCAYTWNILKRTTVKIIKMKNDNVRLHISEFEPRVPTEAKMTRVRLAPEGKVVFALGYDAKETAAVLWDGRGRAYIRPLSRKAEAFYIDARKVIPRRFNGYLYYRYTKFDL